MIFSVKTFQVWNKDDYARQLLIDRKDETMTSSNNVEQNKNQVKKKRGTRRNHSDSIFVEAWVPIIFRIRKRKFNTHKE
jgi:hypothetical protein